MTARRVHVLHVSMATEGPVAEVVAGYVRDQVDRGWHVTVACPSLGGLGYAVREAGAAVRWWRSSAHRGHALGEAMRLGGVVAASEPDVVHLHGGRAGRAGRLAVRDRVPTLYSPHGWGAPGRGGPSAGWERYAARWTTEVVCVSVAERLRGEALGVTTATSLISLGVDLSRFRPASRSDRVVARKRLGLEDRPTVLCVGELALATGQQDLLVDWPRLRAQVPHAQLVLVGDGQDRPALERLAAAEPGVRLVGARTDVPTWLAAADVVVVPSRGGQTALAPLQAMACARSVVATDVDGTPEVLSSPAGAVVVAGDGGALVAEVARRLTHPTLADEEGWNGRAHVELHHDEVASARELAHVYLRLVGARRAR